ncbi:NERD domain-containing protein [Sutcliffiella horikoshii]|uniref:nuclease-related domain-containing protein n=1 Tax=Sutcliffiella horikoshii TaxID=79883 RepID=UPI00203F0AA3|nr:nuclease-related domain-containing protein [Sutcliffiella horikoshii]MCM3619438.1 NERD domain-containing protein [Sutcliffiella horikoshii]
MIKKPREKSVRLLTLEAAVKRVSPDHPKYQSLEKEHARLHYGFIGEKALDYFLTFLPDKNTKLFHGLRIEDPLSRYFQMDTLLITPRYCLILDSKYVSGALEFDEITNQLVRRKGEEKEKFGDPLSQIERQKYQLSLWLDKHHFPPLPIGGQIVLTHSNATLVNATPSLMEKITFHTNLPRKLQAIDDQKFPPLLDTLTFKKLSRMLIKKHTPDEFSLLHHYGIHYHELRKGVFCPGCNYIPMLQKQGRWICKNCGLHSKNAHLKNLMDYKLLVGNIITNRMIRDFLLLPSSNVANYILNSLNLPIEGTYKDRRYLLDNFQTVSNRVKNP